MVDLQSAQWREQQYLISEQNNGSLFMCATSISWESSLTPWGRTGDWFTRVVWEILQDGASWSMEMEEDEPVEPTETEERASETRWSTFVEAWKYSSDQNPSHP